MTYPFDLFCFEKYNVESFIYETENSGGPLGRNAHLKSFLGFSCVKNNIKSIVKESFFSIQVLSRSEFEWSVLPSVAERYLQKTVEVYTTFCKTLTELFLHIMLLLINCEVDTAKYSDRSFEVRTE